MRKLYIYISIIILSFVLQTTKAQDYLLSQPYSNPATIIPSFTGISMGGSASFLYRNQWPGVLKSNLYNTYVFALDYFMQEYNSGLGILVANDVQGDGILKSFSADLQYSYRIKLSRDLYFRPGIKVGLINKSLDYNKMIFSHNIAVDGSIVMSGSPIDFEIEDYNKLDAGFSSLFYNKDFWIGFGLDHLVPNSVSFINEKSKIPMKLDILSGYSWVYKKRGWTNPYDEILTFTFLSQHQGSFNQLDIGVNWSKNPLQCGIWYRNFIIPSSTISSKDAMIFLLGFKTDEFKLSYSYDLSLSELYDSSRGSHEISIVYMFNQKEKQAMDFFCR